MKVYVNNAIIKMIESEILVLETSIKDIKNAARLQNKQVRYMSGYDKSCDELSRLKTALRPLTRQYYNIS